MHGGILLRCRDRDPSSFLPNLYFRWSDGQCRVPPADVGHPQALHDHLIESQRGNMLTGLRQASNATRATLPWPVRRACRVRLTTVQPPATSVASLRRSRPTLRAILSSQ